MYKKYIVLLVIFIGFICEPCYPQTKYNMRVFIDIDTAINISDCETSIFYGETAYKVSSTRFPGSVILIMTVPEGFMGYYYVGKYYNENIKPDKWIHCYKLSSDKKKLVWCNRYKSKFK